MLLGQRTGLFEGRGQFPSLDLGGFDVGLVERVDAEDGAGNRGRHLKPEKFLADMIYRFEDDANHRMSGSFQRRKLVVMRWVAFAFGTEIDEEPILAIERHVAQGGL